MRYDPCDHRERINNELIQNTKTPIRSQPTNSTRNLAMLFGYYSRMPYHFTRCHNFHFNVHNLSYEGMKDHRNVELKVKQNLEMIGGFKKHQSRLTQVYCHLSRIQDYIISYHIF